MNRFMVVMSGRSWLLVDTHHEDARSFAAVFDKGQAYDLAALLNDVDDVDDLGDSFDLNPEPF